MNSEYSAPGNHRIRSVGIIGGIRIVVVEVIEEVVDIVLRQIIERNGIVPVPVFLGRTGGSVLRILLLLLAAVALAETFGPDPVIRFAGLLILRFVREPGFQIILLYFLLFLFRFEAFGKIIRPDPAIGLAGALVQNIIRIDPSLGSFIFGLFFCRFFFGLLLFGRLPLVLIPEAFLQRIDQTQSYASQVF